MGIPVLIIRGILESGKTTFLVDSLRNGDFGDVGKTLVLVQEEGEIEYDKELLEKENIYVEIIDSLADWNDNNINRLVQKVKPQVIFIESNEMWFTEDMPCPAYFDIQQTIVIIDGTTFATYLNNMRQKFQNMISSAELVIINRCKNSPETSTYKNNVKFMNNKAYCIALDENGVQLKLESDLPFSVKEDKINIIDEHFGVWYLDTFENRERYDEKIIEFDCMAVFSRKLPAKTFVAGRLAMTCCANDIQLLGHLCTYKGDLKLKNKQWIRLTSKIRYMHFKGSTEEQIILEAISIVPIEEKDEEESILKLV